MVASASAWGGVNCDPSGRVPLRPAFGRAGDRRGRDAVIENLRHVLAIDGAAP